MSKADILKRGTAMDRSMNGSVFHLWMMFVFAMLASSAQAEGKKDVAFLNNYCLKCHDAEKHKGDVRLDQLALRVTGDNVKLENEDGKEVTVKVDQLSEADQEYLRDLAKPKKPR